MIVNQTPHVGGGNAGVNGSSTNEKASRVAELLAGVEQLRNKRENTPAPIDWRNYLFDTTTPIPEPRFRIAIDGVPVCPDGALCVVNGNEKTGKSQFLTILASVLLSGRPFGSIERLQPAKSILWVDTELPGYYLGTNLARLYKHAGIAPLTDAQKVGLYPVSLYGVSESHTDIINAAIGEVNPDLIVLDGIKDLCENFNDPVQSKLLVDWLAEIMRQRPNLAIFCMIHTNAGTDKMKGHLGSFLHEKFSERFTCTRENDCFKVVHIGRGKPVKSPFLFGINDDGDWYPCSEAEAVGALNSNDALKRIFADGERKTFDQVAKAYKKLTGVSEKEAKNVIRDEYNQRRIRSESGEYFMP